MRMIVNWKKIEEKEKLFFFANKDTLLWTPSFEKRINSSQRYLLFEYTQKVFPALNEKIN